VGAGTLSTREGGLLYGETNRIPEGGKRRIKEGRKPSGEGG